MANLFRSHGDELRGTIGYDDRPIAFSDKWKYRSTSTSGNVATARISTCNGDVDVEATYSPRYLHLTWPGKCYYLGEGLEENNVEAEKWLLKAHQGGREEATVLLFYLYKYLGRNAKAADLYVKVYGNSGDAEKYRLIGDCYSDDQKPREAIKWWRKAANGGDTDAMATLGNYYERAYWEAGLDSVIVISPTSTPTVDNAAEAFKWYSKAASAGNIEAQVNLARCYEMGFGTPENSDKAFRLYFEAAQEGNEMAINAVASHYEYANNLEEAVKWYRKLADEGDPMATYNIASLYERDTTDEFDESRVIKDLDGNFQQLMPRHPDQVIKWYRMSAEADWVMGMDGLARCYEFGIGTPQTLRVPL